MSEILDRIYPDNESQLFFTEIADHRKYIIELEQQLQQAHRAGWIQCQREVVTMLQGYMITFKGDGFSMSCSTNDAAIAIAALEYKEPTNDHWMPLPDPPESEDTNGLV